MAEPGHLLAGKRGLIMGVANNRSIAWGIAPSAARHGGQLAFLYLDTTPENFSKTLLISSYSFTAVAQRAEKLMTQGGSLLTLTYYGAEKWVPHYNVMGIAKAALEASVRYLAADLGRKNIRVNAISAGPIKTLAASGVGDFRYLLRWSEYNAPLRRNVSIDEVGDAALFLLSDLARAVTGENLHVDCGYHIVGMKHPDAPDISVVSTGEQP
jgi:enoyl-[acyl-carrier protein] reductase I